MGYTERVSIAHLYTCMYNVPYCTYAWCNTLDIHVHLYTWKTPKNYLCEGSETSSSFKVFCVYICIIGALCILEDSVYNGSIDQKTKEPYEKCFNIQRKSLRCLYQKLLKCFSEIVIVATIYLSFFQHDCCFCSFLWVAGLTKRVHTLYPLHKCASQIKCVSVLSCHNVKTYFVVRQGTFVHKNWLKQFYFMYSS